MFALIGEDRPADVRDRASCYSWLSTAFVPARSSGFAWSISTGTAISPRLTRPKSMRLPALPPVACRRHHPDSATSREVRPRTPPRELFLAERQAPLRPIDKTTVFLIVARRLRVVCPSLPHHGPHALLATSPPHLLNQGPRSSPGHWRTTWATDTRIRRAFTPRWTSAGPRQVAGLRSGRGPMKLQPLIEPLHRLPPGRWGRFPDQRDLSSALFGRRRGSCRHRCRPCQASLGPSWTERGRINKWLACSAQWLAQILPLRRHARLRRGVTLPPACCRNGHRPSSHTSTPRTNYTARLWATDLYLLPHAGTWSPLPCVPSCCCCTAPWPARPRGGYPGPHRRTWRTCSSRCGRPSSTRPGWFPFGPEAGGDARNTSPGPPGSCCLGGSVSGSSRCVPVFG